MKLKRISALALVTFLLLGIFGTVTAYAVAVNPDRGITEDHIWLKEKDPVDDYAYSMAIVGDTQIVTQNHSKKLSCIYDWIIANKDQKKIKYVIGLGDITNSSSKPEWTFATKEIKKLNGVLPYSLVRGNHDTVATYNQYITKADFGGSVTGSYDDTMLNTYSKFEVGKVKYMILNLDLIASPEVIKWACKVVEENPDYNVIVATHIYMYEGGYRYSIKYISKYGCINDPQYVWDNLLCKYENIKLVLCGHSPSDFVAIRESRGVNGNKVKEILIDPQDVDVDWGGVGLVCMFYFSEDGRKVQVEYYSTIKEKYFLPVNNNLSFELEVVETEEEETTPPETDANVGDKDVATGNNATTVAIIIAIGIVVAAVIISLGYVYVKKTEKKKE